MLSEKFLVFFNFLRKANGSRTFKTGSSSTLAWVSFFLDLFFFRKSLIILIDVRAAFLLTTNGASFEFAADTSGWLPVD